MTTANIKPPLLEDRSKFKKIERVPVFATHVRKLTDQDSKEQKITMVDENQLKVICENTNAKFRSGEYPLITIGHRDFKKPETEQPPLIGFVGESSIGEWGGKPTILSDIFIMDEYKDTFGTYPRRSAEIFSKESPTAYIDSLAVLRRIPALDLGYVTHFEKEENGIESFECEEFSMDAVDEKNPPGKKDESEKKEEPKESTDKDSDKAIEALSAKIAERVSESLVQNDDFLKKVGESASSHFYSNPEALDALIDRLSKPSETDDKSGDTNMSTPETVTNHESDLNSKLETYEKRLGEEVVKNGNLTVRLEGAVSAIDTLKADVKELRGTVEMFSKENESLKLESRNAKRSNRLRQIAIDRNIDIDVEEKMEKFSKLDDETFDIVVGEIEASAPRVPIGNKPVPVDKTSREVKPIKEDEVEQFSHELTEQEGIDGAVEMFAKEKGINILTCNDGVGIVKRYFAEADRSKYGITKKK